MKRLATIVIMSVLAAGPALAQERKPPVALPPVDFAAQTLPRQAAASTALREWLEAASKDGSAFPRAADAGMPGRLVKTAFDKAAITAAPDDGQQIETMCNGASQAMALYLRQGIPPTAGMAAQPLTKEQLDRANANTVTYQDEETLAMDFTLDCVGRLSALGARGWTTLPPSAQADVNRLRGLRQLQGVLVTLYRGGIGTLTSPAFGTPLRTTVAASLVRNAPTYAQFLTTDQRKMITDFIDAQLKTADKTYAADLGKVSAAMQATACTGPCAT
jgi:hypothetical protein